MKKTVKKLTCSVLAAVSVFGCAATLSACETDHPKVQMEISFNDVNYTLDYKLYRKKAPATVKHFLWLADNGYYDGLCVHDYDSANSRMYTGSYTTEANGSAASLLYKKYFDTIEGYSNFNEFPHSVWLKSDKTLPTYTLKGEFSNENYFQVESGALAETYGSLTMHYEKISHSDEAERIAYFLNGESDDVSERKYQYNNATSTFFISLKTDGVTNNSYCTFAVLEDDSKSILEDLQEAIDEYIAKNHSGNKDEFTQEISVDLFEDDELVDSKNSAEYKVPLQPIIVKKVTVKKY